MDKLQEITDYINGMKIKKAFFGGYDREDVYVKLGILTGMFQKYIEDIEEKEKTRIESYEQRIRSSEMLIAELNKKIGTLSAEQRNIDQEKEKMKDIYKEYCSNILQQYSDSLRSLSSEFTQILENVTNLQNNIVNVENLDIFKLEQKEMTKLSLSEETGKEAQPEMGED